MATKHLLIKGQVQGVGYRMSMFYAAKRFSVTGWVRNCRDGSVESMAQGSPDNIDSFIEWAHRGPDLARVDQVIVSEGTGDFLDFSVRDSI